MQHLARRGLEVRAREPQGPGHEGRREEDRRVLVGQRQAREERA